MEPRIARWIGCLLLSVVILTLHHIPAASAPASSVPEVLIWVFSPGTGEDMVSVTYPHIVSEQFALSHIQALVNRTQWRADNFRTDHDESKTSSRFTCRGLVVRSARFLPVAPFAEAFRDLGRIKLVYQLNGEFAFNSWSEIENRYLKISLTRSGNIYIYDVEVLNARFQELRLPGANPERTAKTVETLPTGKLTSLLLLTMQITAILIVGLLVCMGLMYWNRRQREREEERARNRQKWP